MNLTQPRAYKVKPIVGSTGKPIRCEQASVDPLRELAINIAHGSDSDSASPRDRCRYYWENFGEEFPEWFTDADFEILVRLVASQSIRCDKPQCHDWDPELKRCKLQTCRWQETVRARTL